jgi:hypothetical protein
MKISRPASPAQSGTAGKASRIAQSKGKDFAAKLEKAGSKPLPTPTSATPTAARTSRLVSDIGADLKAGRITPQAAIDRVIDRIVAQQLGIHAAPASKEKIGAALRERLADDPLLAAKVRALSEE